MGYQAWLSLIIAQEDFKDILKLYVDVLVDLKTQVDSLACFFYALSVMATNVIQRLANDFISEGESAKRCIIGKTSMSDFSRQSLYTATLMCQAYISHFSTFAVKYNEISHEYIVPGVRLCGRLGVTVDDVTLRELRSSMEKARESIKHEAEQVSPFLWYIAHNCIQYQTGEKPQQEQVG